MSNHHKQKIIVLYIQEFGFSQKTCPLVVRAMFSLGPLNYVVHSAIFVIELACMQ